MRATLSREKKCEITLLSFNHRFVGQQEISGETVLVFQPIDGTRKIALVPLNSKEMRTTKELLTARFDKSFITEANINKLTGTNNGLTMKNEYFKQSEEAEYQTSRVAESKLNAFHDQILANYKAKAKAEQFKLFNSNLTQLQNEISIDETFLEEMTGYLFPDKTLNSVEENANDTKSTTSVVQDEANA